jgi:hypothetical protein
VVLLYFAAGILSDLMVTAYTLSVSRGWAWAASLVSIPIALLSFWVLRFLEPAPVDAVAYAVGNAVGCFAIMAVSRARRFRTAR